MTTTTNKPTPFERALEHVRQGKLHAPSVSMGKTNIPYFKYQLATSHFHLKIMASGMKAKNVKLKNFKEYYGLTGKSAKECLIQFEEIKNKYEQEQTQMN